MKLLLLLIIFSSCATDKKNKYLFVAFFKDKAKTMSPEEMEKHNSTDVQGGVALIDSYKENRKETKTDKYSHFMFKAIKKKSSRSFKRMLARSNVNLVDPVTGDSLLHYAIIMKRAAHVKVILSQKPSMKHKNKKGYNPLALAKRLKRKKIIKIITRHLREQEI